MPWTSCIVVGVGVLLFASSMALNQRRRAIYAILLLGLLLAGTLVAPLPTSAPGLDDEWMGDYRYYTANRRNFEVFAGYEAVPFPHHLTAVLMRALDSALGATVESSSGAFRWLSTLAGGLFVLELVGVGAMERWSAAVMRYLALCVAAPATLLFFGFRDVGYLALSAAGLPLLMRGLTVAGRESAVVGSAVVLGLRSALHGFGLLSLAGALLGALASVGKLRDRLGRAVVFSVWASAAYLGWLVWYLVGLGLQIHPGHASNIVWRPLLTSRVAEHERIVHPMLSGPGLRDIIGTAIIVGVPLLLLGLSQADSRREQRLGILFALPSLVALAVWWPVQGVDREMDLVFASFPAVFVGAWLSSKSTRATALGMGLAGLAHVAFWYVVLSGHFGDTRQVVRL